MAARRVFVALPFLLLLTLLAQASLETPGERPRYKSPLGIAVDRAGRIAYVALHTAHALAVVDVHTSQVLCEIPVGRYPYDVALHKGSAYVTCEADDTLVEVDTAARKVKRVYNVGQAPRGVSVDPASGLIQVVCHDDRVLWTRNAAGVCKTEPIPPQPEGNYARARNLELVLTNEATYRQVPRPFNLFTRGQSIFDPNPAPPLARPMLGATPPRTAFDPTTDLDLTRTSMDLVAHTRPRWFTPTANAVEGRIFTNAFSFFLNRSTSAAVVLLDEPGKGYPDPTDVIVKLPRHGPGTASLAPLSKSGKAATHPLVGARVFISSGGADTVVVLDLSNAASHFEANRSMHFNGFGSISGGWGGSFNGGAQFGGGYGMSGNIGGGFNGGGFNGRAGFNGGAMPGGISGGGMMSGGVPGSGMIGGMSGGGMIGWQGGFTGFHENLHASAIYTLARLPTQANPRRMVLTPDGKTLLVSNHLADSLTVIDADKLKVLRHIGLGGPEPDLARRGDILFHSAKHTFQQQFTCASCHPNNGADGLSWDTSPKGNGERLNTRALHGVRDTAPFGWRGESETLENRAKNTMREVHKHKLSDADASAIAAYLNTLDPPRPIFLKAKEVPAVERGRNLFFGKGNCTSCHRGPAFTSASPRAVILDHKKKRVPFDVPSLRGVARTAPYLHDGRAATLEEIFEKHNPENRHGRAHELTAKERKDVVAFLKSL